jgi:Glycosyl hydrolase family 63 C-terminal domain
LKVRSLVGLTTLFATFCIDKSTMDSSPEFVDRLNWFNGYLKKHKDYTIIDEKEGDKILLSLIPKARLERLLQAMLDEREFLSDFGIRALSKIHENGINVHIQGEDFGLKYEPAESSSGLFGGNSNWRGPIWLPMNYMLIESLKKFNRYYGDDLKVECPTGSGVFMNLGDVAIEITKRLAKLFTLDKDGNRPINGLSPLIHRDEHFKDLILFYMETMEGALAQATKQVGRALLQN